MYELGLDPATSPVFFGQLLGMADPLSFVLGNNKYKSYKYTPWGHIEEVMPYLIRRAQENSTVMGGVQKEKDMLLAELWRRIRQDYFPMSLFSGRRAASAAA
jgi:proline dehydrogenase